MEVSGSSMTSADGKLISTRMHVYSDLRSYICTHNDCTDYLLRFESREAWANHEFANHRVQRQYACSLCENVSSNMTELQEHRLSEHAKGSINLGAALQESTDTIESQQCHICKMYPSKSMREFVRHVAEHMEGISLLSIPRELSDDEDDDTSNDDGSQPELRTATMGSHSSDATDNQVDITSADNASDDADRSARKVKPITPESGEPFQNDTVGDMGAMREPAEKRRFADSKIQPPLRSRKSDLNEYWFDGAGIKREVLQGHICDMLGDDAICIPNLHQVRT